MTRAQSAPPVYADLSQEELDRAYDQGFWAANGIEIQERIVARSRAVARRMPPITQRYGQAEEQLIDFFVPAGARRAPVIVLIHGGGWRLALRESFYGPAPALTTAGCILAVPGFQCLPAISMVAMAEQIRQAIGHIVGTVAELGGDPRNLHIAGHSSGAHLAAVSLASASGTLRTSLRGGTLISGLYDLEPVLLSSRRHYIALRSGEAAMLSPLLHPLALAGKASVWWGTGESPEFQRQSQVFAHALEAAGRLDRSAALAGRNHFEMLEQLDDPQSPIVRSLLAAVG